MIENCEWHWQFVSWSSTAAWIRSASDMGRVPGLCGVNCHKTLCINPPIHHHTVITRNYTLDILLISNTTTNYKLDNVWWSLRVYSYIKTPSKPPGECWQSSMMLYIGLAIQTVLQHCLEWVMRVYTSKLTPVCENSFGLCQKSHWLLLVPMPAHRKIIYKNSSKIHRLDLLWFWFMVYRHLQSGDRSIHMTSRRNGQI